MKIGDTARLNASPEDVFDALQDPAVLAAAIPGVQKLDRVEEDHYTATIVAGVAAIKGSFTGEVTLSEKQRPNSLMLTASGSGAPGTIKAIVTVRLAPIDDDGTELTFEADAVVGGMLGGVGQRMITGVAKKMAGVFFATVDEIIAHGIPETAGTRPPAGDVATADVASSGSATSGALAAPRAIAGARGAPGELGFAAGLVAGAVISFVGVAIGARITRR